MSVGDKQKRFEFFVTTCWNRNTTALNRGYMEPGGYAFHDDLMSGDGDYYNYAAGDSLVSTIPPPFYDGDYYNYDAGDSYVNSCILTTGVVKYDEGKFPLDQGLENIVSYNRARKNDAYIGEFNMIKSASFSGDRGIVWGLDIAIAPEIKQKTLNPLFIIKESGYEIPVYPCNLYNKQHDNYLV